VNKVDESDEELRKTTTKAAQKLTVQAYIVFPGKIVSIDM
jgi:hypothetical protein